MAFLQKRDKVTASLIRLLIVALPLAGLSGCARFGARVARALSPVATISTAGGASVAQSGDAQTPAAVTVTTESQSLPLPAGSEVAAFRGASLPAFVFKLSRESALTSQVKTEHAEAPRSFAPPAPPTPAQTAAGEAVRWFYLAGLGCFLVAGLLAWATHYLAAIKLGLAGLSLLLLPRLFGSGVATLAAACLACAGAAFFAAWHILQKRDAQSNLFSR